MFRLIGFTLLVVVLLGAGAPTVSAQVGSVRVFTKPSNITFYVDEQSYSNDMTLLWPAGSKHFIQTDTKQCGVRPKTCYTLSGVTTNLGTPASVWPITADPGLTYVELDFTVSYAVTLSYSPCPSTDPLGCTVGGFPPPQAGACPTDRIGANCWPPSAGEVSINGQVFWANGEVYMAAGSRVSVEAHPAQGCSGNNSNCNGSWIFTGWGQIPGVPLGSTFIWSFPLNGPAVVHPIFQQAQPIEMHVGTTPAGLQVLVDRTPIILNCPPTACPFTIYYWGWGTDHELGAIPVQLDANGHEWIFSSWSDGGQINHTYHVAGATGQVAALTATFVPGTNVTFLTDPPLLKLSVDGRTNWQNYSFDWAQGTTHTVSAPLTQTDSQGHTYRFVGWSNGGSASQQYTVSSGDDTRLTATYKPVGQVTVNTVPPGILLQVDGANCTTPCSVEHDVGVNVNVAAPTMLSPGDGARMVFQGWSDSSSPTRILTTAATATSITASYQTQYQLATGADPSNGVVWSISPTTADGYYDSQSVVVISASTNPGYRFLNWSGDATGATQPLAVRMSAPKAITAVLDSVPYVIANGVKNAAGDTPEAIVAPGSVVSIVGVNFAQAQEQGPTSPLKQTLSGITADASGVLMPLFSVSPTQINAQLPYEIWEGDQTLTLRVPGKPPVKQVFSVSRNAPGLFTSPIGDTPYVLAAHADGTPITPDSPAAQGETVTIFGTGFGPYSGSAPDGFALPLDPNWMLLDPVDLLVGDAHVPLVYAGTAAQKVGVNAISFIVSSDLPQATNAPVKVRINGHESNVAVLPLQ